MLTDPIAGSLEHEAINLSCLQIVYIQLADNRITLNFISGINRCRLSIKHPRKQHRQHRNLMHNYSL